MTPNVGYVPMFVGSRSNEVSDLIIWTPKIVSLIRDWRVLDQVSLSDYRYLEFKLAIPDEQKKKTKFSELLNIKVQFLW